MKRKPTKCELLQDKVYHLCHVVSAESVASDQTEANILKRIDLKYRQKRKKKIAQRVSYLRIPLEKKALLFLSCKVKILQK